MRKMQPRQMLRPMVSNGRDSRVEHYLQTYSQCLRQTIGATATSSNIFGGVAALVAVYVHYFSAYRSGTYLYVCTCSGYVMGRLRPYHR